MATRFIRSEEEVVQLGTSASNAGLLRHVTARSIPTPCAPNSKRSQSRARQFGAKDSMILNAPSVVRALMSNMIGTKIEHMLLTARIDR
jgi:hypothetical protein